MWTLEMRNDKTGEVAPAHFLGTDEDGRNIYQAVEGWTLYRDDAEVTEHDADGNCLMD